MTEEQQIPRIEATQGARQLYERAFGQRALATFGDDWIAFAYGDRGLTHFRSWVDDDVQLHMAQINGFHAVGVVPEDVIDRALENWKARP